MSKHDTAGDVIMCPDGTSGVKVISCIYDGTYWLAVHFLRGKGKSFNTYTRGQLWVGPAGNQNNWKLLWQGWLSGMPDPMDSSNRTEMYEWASRTPRVRRWLAHQIETYNKERAS